MIIYSKVYFHQSGQSDEDRAGVDWKEQEYYQPREALEEP